MKASELRIGNLFYEETRDNPYDVIQIYELSETSVNDWDVVDVLKIYDPILITEDWFLRCGGVKEIYTDDEPDDYYLVIRHKEFDIIYESDDEIYCDINGWVIDLKYVHQLQNLWFALTGKELKIKK